MCVGILRLYGPTDVTGLTDDLTARTVSLIVSLLVLRPSYPRCEWREAVAGRTILRARVHAVSRDGLPTYPRVNPTKLGACLIA